MKSAEAVVAALLDGKVGDWLSDRWNDIKVATGIGQDSLGLGKAEKGFKPKYGPRGPTAYKPTRRRPETPKTWDVD